MADRSQKGGGNEALASQGNTYKEKKNKGEKGGREGFSVKGLLLIQGLKKGAIPGRGNLGNLKGGTLSRFEKKTATYLPRGRFLLVVEKKSNRWSLTRSKGGKEKLGSSWLVCGKALISARGGGDQFKRGV